MIVLSPGVIVSVLKQKKKRENEEKIYPIELYFGGTITNIGIE
jgi:hypothetical protein